MSSPSASSKDASVDELLGLNELVEARQERKAGAAVGALEEGDKKRKKALEDRKEDKSQQSVEAEERAAAYAMAALARYKAERQLKDMRARDANRAAEEKLAKAAAEKKRTAQKKANEGQAKHRKALRGKLGEDAYLAKQRATRQKNREKNRAREKKKKEDAEKKQNTNSSSSSSSNKD